MERFLFGSLLLPAFEGLIKRRKTFRYWRELEKSQWLPRNELEQLQFDRLRDLVRHAFAHCPYYREAWQERGLSPEQLQTPADWRRWPLLRRDEINAQRFRMRADVPGLGLLSKSTGGSSGVPLHFDLSLESHERRTAATYRGYNWAGAGPGTKQLYLWGVPLQPRSRFRRWKDRCWDRFHRRLTLSCFDLSEERIPAFFQTLNRYRPDVIVAYSNAIHSFAQMLADRALTPWSPCSIVVGAEKLYPAQRELIERVFRAPVFETYGAREFMLIGAECERHAGFHLSMENLLVEVLDDEGRPVPDGEVGNVVVTDLTNHGMPFVRYVNGDRAVAGWGCCPCGRGLPLLRSVVGRSAEEIVTPDGRRLSGLFFPHLLKDYASVRRFQVIQDSADHVDVRLVVSASWDDSQRLAVERALHEGLGPAVRVSLRLVDDIPLTAAGKHRVVVNLCRKGSGPD